MTQVIATEEIKKGQQVCLTYGNLANWLLLQQWGFVLTELVSPPDVALVDCAPCFDGLKADESAAAQLMELCEDSLLMREGDGSVSSWQPAGNRLQAALLSLATKGRLPAEPDAAGEDPNSAAAKAAASQYRALLQGTLDGYSTSIAEDRTALGLVGDGLGAAPEELPPRTRLAMQFRLSQKTLLNKALAASVTAGPQSLAEAAARLKFEVLGERVYAAATREPGALVTGSGLIVKHEVEGTGATPTRADTVEVHYEGRNADGIVFDSSYASGEPIAFPVTGVIAGWTEALQMMRVGGKALLTIPPHLAYGDEGSPPKIPSKATRIFTVELLGVK